MNDASQPFKYDPICNAEELGNTMADMALLLAELRDWRDQYGEPLTLQKAKTSSRLLAELAGGVAIFYSELEVPQ